MTRKTGDVNLENFCHKEALEQNIQTPCCSAMDPMRNHSLTFIWSWWDVLKAKKSVENISIC